MKKLLLGSRLGVKISVVVASLSMLLLLLLLFGIVKENNSVWTMVKESDRFLGAFACLLVITVCLTVPWTNADWLVEEWNHSTGLHHWTELPKGKTMMVIARSLIHGNTLLGLMSLEGHPCLWFVEFAVLLPVEVACQATIVILNDEKQLLHCHAQAGVIPLFVKDLEPQMPAPDSKDGRVALMQKAT